MLCSVLNSETAIQINIAIIRTFIALKKQSHLSYKMEAEFHEFKKDTTELFKIVFQKFEVTDSRQPKRKKIGLIESKKLLKE